MKILLSDEEWVREIKNKTYHLNPSPKMKGVELTDDEKRWIELTFTCPDCLGGIFDPGPRGGSSINVACSACHTKFNLGVYKDIQQKIHLLVAGRI